MTCFKRSSISWAILRGSPNIGTLLSRIFFSSKSWGNQHLLLLLLKDYIEKFLNPLARKNILFAKNKERRKKFGLSKYNFFGRIPKQDIIWVFDPPRQVLFVEDLILPQKLSVHFLNNKNQKCCTSAKDLLRRNITSRIEREEKKPSTLQELNPQLHYCCATTIQQLPIFLQELDLEFHPRWGDPSAIRFLW